MVAGVVAVVAVLGLGAGSCQPTPPPRHCAQAGLATTVAYRTVAGAATGSTSLDIHAPKGACDAPVVLWVHGGGYHGGDKAGKGTAAKTALFNAHGWIFVSVNYRLTVAGDPASAHFPDHYEDVAAAIAWTKAHIGAYGGDQSRLAVLGHSAGADIVANVVDQSRYLHAVGLPVSSIRCAGPLDTEGFDKPASHDPDADQWADALGNQPDYLESTSATRFISGYRRPDTIGVYRGTAGRQAIERAYLAKVASTGARTTLVDARSLTHEEVNTRIGAAGDQIITPPLVAFLTTCFR